MTEESSDTKTCPFCAETIKAAAIVCKHCGRDLPKEESADELLMRVHGITISDGRYVWRGNHFKSLGDAVAFATRPSALDILGGRLDTPPPKPIFEGLPMERDNQQSAGLGRFKWLIFGPLGALALLFTWGALTGPKTYKDLADMEERACIRSKGDGYWKGSSGVSLETFCKTAGNIEARKQMCKAYPENC